MQKRSNILLIVLKSRKTVPDAGQPKQLSEERRREKAKPGVLDKVSKLER